MKQNDATFDIIKTGDQQLVLRGVYYGQHHEIFKEVITSFQKIAENFSRNHAFSPIGPPRIKLVDNQRIHLQVFDIVDESSQVDEIVEWSRDMAQKLFLTPQQYFQQLRKNVI